MKKALAMILAGILVFLLAACGGSQDTGDTVTVEFISLSEDYEDALPIDGQLALGTLELEGDLAVDEPQAAELLPLWQGYQSLSNSDKAAEAELNALLKQIQSAMREEQMSTIAGMKLTSKSASTWMQENGGFGRGFMRPSGDDSADQEGGGFFPGGFPGGVPGEMPGSGPGGGGFPGGGPGGGFGQGAGDPNARATRVAEMGGEEGDMGQFMNRAVVGRLIQELQIKTGQLDPAELESGRNLRNPWAIISEETGIDMETLQAGMSEGKSLAEVITENGGDLGAVEQALREAFSQLPNLQEEGQLDEYIDSLLDSTPELPEASGE